MSDLDDLALAAGNAPPWRASRSPVPDRTPVYMVFDRGTEWGPFSQAEVWLYWGEGRFNDAAEARHVGHPSRFALAALLPPPLAAAPEFAAAQFAPEAVASPSWHPEYRPGMHTHRIAAGVFALLLPAGIHKMLMGFVGTGVVQLLLTFATCGVASVIAFVEGIIYLTKSEEQFFYDYHVNKRTWF